MNAASVLNNLLGNPDTSDRRKPPQANQAKARTTTILNHLRLGRLGKAVSVLFAAPFPFPFPLYAELFQICASKKALIEARKVESHLVSFSPTPPVFLLNRAIETYGKCGCLEDAKSLFEEMPQRDGGSWNALISAYWRNGASRKALDVFHLMHESGIFASEVTFASVLGSCGSELNYDLLRQMHALLVKYGFRGNVILESSLVDVYGKCGMMSEARRMFDEIEHPSGISWNVIVRRYLEIGEGEEAVVMFSKMIRINVRPLSFTVSNALVACSHFGGIKEGAQIHGFAIKIDSEQEDIVMSSLIDMYMKCGDLESAQRIFDLPFSKDLITWTSMVSGYAMRGRTREARKLFDEMPERNLISWNAMLAGYTRFSQWDDAFPFVMLMIRATTRVDEVTVALILNMCAGLSDVERGKQVHGYIYRKGIFFSLYVGNALIDMYGKCGNMQSARICFNQLSHLQDIVSWNALLTSHVRHGLSEQAITIFEEMLGETIPNKYTFGTLFAACANIFALDLGKQIHGFIIRNGYEIDIVIRGALVDMYSKCRSPDYALNVFRETAVRDVLLWNSMMLGLCHNRRGLNVLQLFETMEKEGIKPDNITLQAILLACVSEGRVELGRWYFDRISDKYCIIPRPEHYDCMIELYGRFGFMRELDDFINNMPFEPTVPMLIRVFEFCQQHRYFKLGHWAADQLNKVDPSVQYKFEV